MKKREMLCLTTVLTLAAQPGITHARQTKTVNSQPQAENRMMQEKQGENEAPFACSLIALSAAQRAHHRDLSKELRAAVKDTREVTDGYAFRFAGEGRTIAMLAEWISLERLCCPFFAFQLEIGSDSKPIWLRITGREGVKPFMRSEFGIK